MVNFPVEILRHAGLLGHKKSVFITPDDVISGVLVMYFGGTGQEADRHHERFLGVLLQFLYLQLLRPKNFILVS